MIMMVRETLSHHYTTTYQLSLTYLKRQKVIAQTQTHFKNINYLTLKSKVKLRSRWNTTHCLMIIHGTPTYQISLIYRKKQKGYDSDTITLKKYQLFDLNVKGQRQNVVMKLWSDHRGSQLYFHITRYVLKRRRENTFWGAKSESRVLAPFFASKTV